MIHINKLNFVFFPISVVVIQTDIIIFAHFSHKSLFVQIDIDRKKKKNCQVPDKTVMRARAVIAPANTIKRGCRIAMIAAIKNVLSPNSDTTITDNDAMNARKKFESFSMLTLLLLLLILSGEPIVSPPFTVSIGLF